MKNVADQSSCLVYTFSQYAPKRHNSLETFFKYFTFLIQSLINIERIELEFSEAVA